MYGVSGEKTATEAQICESKEIKRLSITIVETLRYAKQNTVQLEERIAEFIFCRGKAEKVEPSQEAKDKSPNYNIISDMNDNLAELWEVLNEQRELIDGVLTKELRKL